MRWLTTTSLDYRYSSKLCSRGMDITVSLITIQLFLFMIVWLGEKTKNYLLAFFVVQTHAFLLLQSVSEQILLTLWILLPRSLIAHNSF